MKVLIAGGRGFVGTALANELRAGGHQVWTLTRASVSNPADVRWDGGLDQTLSSVLNEMDAVVNATGFGLQHWPWTTGRKRSFTESRVTPARTLTAAILSARHRPGVFLQVSGINYYGLRGATVADESTPAADDFLARLTIEWEAASSPLERAGVRRVVARSAILLDAHGGLLPLMALPVRLFVGGRLGDGKQAVPWIHVTDHIRAVRFLLENEHAAGAYNLVAPTPTSNDEFLRAVARAIHRPYWLPTPAILLRMILGEMCVLILEGRYCRPARLLDMRFGFDFPTIESALENIFGHR